MKRSRALLALGAFFLPLVFRGLWFYQGIYRVQEPISTPDYAAIELPKPPPGDDSIDGFDLSAEGKTILFDLSHNNQFSIGELEGFIADLRESGASIEFVRGSFSGDSPSLAERFRYADAFIVIAPQIEFSDSSVQEISRFTERGGRILVISDPTRSSSFSTSDFSLSNGDVVAVNSLLVPFGIVFSEDYVYNLIHNEGNYRNVLFHEFVDDDLTVDLNTVAFYSSRSISSISGKSLIIGDEETLSSRTDTGGNLSVTIRSQDSNVLAIGDLTFLTTPYDQVADNPQFIANIMEFLVGGERQRDLTDFPYVFNQPISILITDTFSLAAETIQTISGTQRALLTLGYSINYSDEAAPDSDLIIFTSFKVDDAVLPYIETIEGLQLPQDTEDGLLHIPGFGEVTPSGIGLLLLAQSEERTVLFFMADSAENLLSLAETITTVNLDHCLVQPHAAICKVGLGEGFQFDQDLNGEGFNFEFDDSILEDFPLEDEPIVPSPTPVG
jgi:hypothetical protein